MKARKSMKTFAILAIVFSALSLIGVVACTLLQDVIRPMYGVIDEASSVVPMVQIISAAIYLVFIVVYLLMVINVRDINPVIWVVFGVLGSVVLAVLTNVASVFWATYISSSYGVYQVASLSALINAISLVTMIPNLLRTVFFWLAIGVAYVVNNKEVCE